MFPEHPFEYIDRVWPAEIRQRYAEETVRNESLPRIADMQLNDSVFWHFVRGNNTLGSIEGKVTFIDKVTNELHITLHKGKEFPRGEVHIFNMQNGVSQDGPIGGWIVVKATFAEWFNRTYRSKSLE